MAGRMDPFNLVGVARPSADGWVYAATGEKIKGERLSEIGHGNIAPIPAHGGVTVSGISRMATISFAALDRIRFDAAEAGGPVRRSSGAGCLRVAGRPRRLRRLRP
jgi:CRISPR-associated protein Csb1